MGRWLRLHGAVPSLMQHLHHQEGVWKRLRKYYLLMISANGLPNKLLTVGLHDEFVILRFWHWSQRDPNALRNDRVLAEWFKALD